MSDTDTQDADDGVRRLFRHLFRSDPYEPPPELWPKIRRRLRQNAAVEAAKARLQPKESP